MDRWAGKVAIVTGASAGMGEAIAMSLVESGLQVVGLARRLEKLEALAKKLEGSKGKFHPLRCDLRQEEDILQAFDWVEKNLGGPDILVNNAGIFAPNLITEDSTENYRKIMDLNLIAVAICTREAVKSIKTRGVPGHIININSIVGHNTMVSQEMRASLYSPSKFALRAMTDLTRRELSKVKPAIKVTVEPVARYRQPTIEIIAYHSLPLVYRQSLSPGLVKTEILEAAGIHANIFDQRPHIMPKDIADAVTYVLGTPPTVQVDELIITPAAQ